MNDPTKPAAKRRLKPSAKKHPASKVVRREELEARRTELDEQLDELMEHFKYFGGSDYAKTVEADDAKTLLGIAHELDIPYKSVAYLWYVFPSGLGLREFSAQLRAQVQRDRNTTGLNSLTEHAEKAEAGRERLLEELRGLRLELVSLRRRADSNTDRTFYVACACLGVLVLTRFFK